MRKLRLYNILGLNKQGVKTIDEIIREKLEYDPSNYEFLVVVGGDGTILDKNIKEEALKKPVLRVHPKKRRYFRKGERKSLAYSADVYLKNLDKAIDDLTKGEYSTEKASLMDCFIDSKYVASALNDIGVEGERRLSNILFKVTVKGDDGYQEKLPSPKCTGVVVSGKYAATAWNLSLDGPIPLHKDEFLIDFREPPIKQAHWTAPLDDTILIELFNDSVVSVDRLIKHVPSGTRIKIKKSDKVIEFIRTENTKESLISKINRYNKFHGESL